MDQMITRPGAEPRQGVGPLFCLRGPAAQVNTRALIGGPSGRGLRLVLNAKGLPALHRRLTACDATMTVNLPSASFGRRVRPALSEAGPHEVVFYSFSPLPPLASLSSFRLK